MAVRARRARVAGALRLIGALTLIAPVAVAGCGSGPARTAPGMSSGGRAEGIAYWTRDRFLGATPLGQHQPKQARTAISAPRVGALFYHDLQGGHFCTASVVDSPHHNLLVTAAHCVHGGKDAGYRQDIVFVPGYRQGQAPYGVWQPGAITVDDRWTRSSDPDLDVAFVALQPNDNKEVGEVLGANLLDTGQGTHLRVRVTGYPDDGSDPITCSNWTTAQSPTQLRFACGGYASGTSGSPWLTAFDPTTRTGQIVGVIGGYQEGGDTPQVSYSPYFGADVHNLHQQALAKS